jgi:hypothetical protein
MVIPSGAQAKKRLSRESGLINPPIQIVHNTGSFQGALMVSGKRHFELCWNSLVLAIYELLWFQLSRRNSNQMAKHIF